MGLFDDIFKKAAKAVDKSEGGFLSNLENTIKEGIETISTSIPADSSSPISEENNEGKKHVIPSEYDIFPTYPGKMLHRPQETKTSKYTRVTMRYKGEPSIEFIQSLETSGFSKSTNVRYDKGNTYVIIDPKGGQTEIVYHIKK